MFPTFKKLLDKFSGKESAPLATAAPANAPAAPVRPAAAPRPAPAAAPAAAAAGTSTETLSLPLLPVLDHLPEAFRTAVVQRPDSETRMQLPLRLITSQLPRGAVKISFAELRAAAPAGVFRAGAVPDSTLVDLALQDIVPHMKAALLTRRPQQKVVEVPTDVVPIFGPKGQTAPLPPRETAPRPSAPTAAPATTAPAPVATKPMPAAMPVAPVTPAPPTFRMAQPAPAPAKPASPVAAPVVAVATPAPAPAAGSDTVSISLTECMPGWPAELQQEIARLNLGGATVALPAAEVELALKRGKIAFAWKQLRAWLQPTPAPPSASDEAVVELPLKTIVPLFLSLRAPTKPQKTVTVADNIPNLFASSAAPAPTPAQARATAEAATAAPAVPAVESPAPVQVAEPALPEFGQIFGQPEKKNWTPMEIAQKTRLLPGVAGAAIALHDGLLVASDLPADFNGEMFAAFLPQMFSRMSQYTKEISLGEPSQIALVLPKGPLQVMRAGRVYFTVLGRAGQPLPVAQLTAIAAQLGRQSK